MGWFGLTLIVVERCSAVLAQAGDGSEQGGVPGPGQEEPHERTAPRDRPAARPRERHPAQPGLRQAEEPAVAVVHREQQQPRDVDLGCPGTFCSEVEAILSVLEVTHRWYWTCAQIALLVATGFYQAKHLKAFFRKKKLV